MENNLSFYKKLSKIINIKIPNLSFFLWQSGSRGWLEDNIQATSRQGLRQGAGGVNPRLLVTCMDPISITHPLRGAALGTLGIVGDLTYHP